MCECDGEDLSETRLKGAKFPLYVWSHCVHCIARVRVRANWVSLVLTTPFPNTYQHMPTHTHTHTSQTGSSSPTDDFCSTSFDGRSSTPPTHNTADNARRYLFGAPLFGEGSKVTTTMTSVDQFGAVSF